MYSTYFQGYIYAYTKIRFVHKLSITLKQLTQVILDLNYQIYICMYVCMYVCMYTHPPTHTQPHNTSKNLKQFSK